jgi:hypothetical protein
MKPNREYFIHRLNETRVIFEDLLPGINVENEIYPGWTIKDVLVHMTGWDDVVIASLRAAVAGRILAISAGMGVDEFNKGFLNSSLDLDFDRVVKDWHMARQILLTVIDYMPEEDIVKPVMVPWGEKLMMKDLVEIFHDHENTHAQEISEWLNHPDKPLK